MQHTRDYQTNKNLTITPLLAVLLASIGALISYVLFYAFSPIVLSLKPPLNVSEFAPHVRFWIRTTDGIETYVMYGVMLLNLMAACFIGNIFLKGIYSKKSIILIAVSSIFVFCICVGFNLPGSMVSKSPHQLITTIVVLAITVVFFCWLYGKDKFLAYIFLIIVLLPICFIPTFNPQMDVFDYSYIFSPALRILYGESFKNIYFQYDLLLSLIAATWMKLGFDLQYAECIGQFAFYLFFITLFYFADKFFLTKKLCVPFIIFLVIVRYYAMPADVTDYLQTTPLRLDWWLPLLYLSYRFGFYHWSVGLLIGSLVLLHKSFGIIYFASYILAGITFILVSDFRLFKESSLSFIGSNFFYNTKNFLINLFIVSIFFLLSAFIFGDFYSKSAKIYLEYGIGMLPISRTSFYWYVLILAAAVFLLTAANKHKLPNNYYSSVIFLIYLIIGNSLYFFGRSHEYNIINISGGLILLAFIFIDIANHVFNKSPILSIAEHNFIKICPFTLVFAAGFIYAPSINMKMISKYQIVTGSSAIYEVDRPPPWVFSTIAALTNNSRKVYFMDKYDFLYNYYGGYKPMGYYSPYNSWVIKAELVTFLQGLLDSGVYLVCESQTCSTEVISDLQFTSIKSANGYSVIEK